MKKHFLVLDSLRGIFACIVAITHFNAYSYISGYKIVDFGAIYVDFFFVLSGFVIFANYAEKLRTGFGVGKFMFLRLGRLYPLHFAVLMAFVLSDFAQYLLPTGGALYAPFSAPGESWPNILANFLLVHSLNLTDILILNGPSWSISVEIFTYILFALILVYVRKYQIPFVAVLGVSSAVLLYSLSGELYAKLDYGFLRCVYGFACGALIWELYTRTSEKIEGAGISFLKWSVLEVALIAFMLIYITFFSEDLLSMAAPFLMSAVVYCFIFEGGIFSQVLKAKIFLLLGTLSYSIYMVHIFISGKFFELPIRILEGRGIIEFTQIENGLRLYGLDKVSGTAIELFYLVVVVCCAYLSYIIIEQPFRRLSKRMVASWGGDHNSQKISAA